MASLGQHGTSHIHHHIDWAIATVDQASSYNTGPYCSCRLRRLRSLRAYVLSTRAMAASAACSTGHRLIRAKVAIRIASTDRKQHTSRGRLDVGKLAYLDKSNNPREIYNKGYSRHPTIIFPKENIGPMSILF